MMQPNSESGFLTPLYRPARHLYFTKQEEQKETKTSKTAEPAQPVHLRRATTRCISVFFTGQVSSVSSIIWMPPVRRVRRVLDPIMDHGRGTGRWMNHTGP